ncbi:EGF-like, conserved site [Pycnococcus provasolii]
MDAAATVSMSRALAARRCVGAPRPRPRPFLVALLALLALVRPCASSAVWTRMFPLGDKNVNGEYGPSPRMGHAAVAVGERVFVFGGRGEFLNGDFLNDMWMYDWATGNWTAYYPNELVCDECSVCNSVLANQLPGHTFIKSDEKNDKGKGIYVPCNPWDEQEYLDASANTRLLGESPGGSCEYHTTCFDWTGLRPYAEPTLIEGMGRNKRQVPAGRYEHLAQVVLNRNTNQRDLIIMFGGYSVDCSDYCSDVWHHHVTRNVWTKVSNFTRPGPARRWKSASAVYEDIVYIFGGHGARLSPLGEGQVPVKNEVYDHKATFDPNNPLMFDDLWAYNATEREWTRLFPTCTTCTNKTEPDGTVDRDLYGPRGRQGSILINHDRHLYLFGGYAFGGPTRYQSLYPTGNATAYPSLTSKYYLNDLWRYDISRNTWEEIQPRKGYTVRPSPRYGHSATLSQRRQHSVILIFGGRTWDDEIGDLWQYNISGNTFVKVTGEGEYPARRYSSGLVSVGSSSLNTEGRALIIGGHGCYSGENYVAATKSKAPTNKPNPSYNNRWVQLHNDYGEKFCHHMLGDLWQYYPTSCPNDCSRKGICEYNVCVCETGFTGADCSMVTCPGDECKFDYLARELDCFQCTNRGVCNGFTGQCECVFPAGGPSCNQFECLNDCNNNGVCDKTTANEQGYGTCKCHMAQGRPAYTGIDCAVSVCPAQNVTISKGTCNSRGICVNGTCVCHPGYGDSFLHRIINKDTDEEQRIPIYLDGTDIPKVLGPDGKERLVEEPIMVGDCGDVAFVFAGVGKAQWLLAMAIMLVVHTTTTMPMYQTLE